MKSFSIRRNKQNASDPATVVTEDPPMSTSQRSVYGSVMSSKTRNRLHKPHHSLDETHDPQNNDIIKRPHRKLVKKFRQHQRSDSSPEERVSVTPPEQKPHSSSLPVTLRRSIEQPDHDWSEDRFGSPSRSRAPLAHMRHSVGSSADVLLTPIRGSTAIGDDFVFLPTSRVVETSGPDDIAASPDTERPESPGPTIFTLHTESEMHHDVEHERTADGDHDVDNQGGVLEATSNSSSSEPGAEDVVLSQSQTSVAETRTIRDLAPVLAPEPQPSANPVEPPKFDAPTVLSVHEDPPLPAISVIKPPVHKIPRPVLRPVVATRITSKGSSVKTVEPRNVVPFPSPDDAEKGPWHATLMKSEISFDQTIPDSETALVYWAIAIWSTLAGIWLVAMECFRWLARKGMRDDFRSCLSYWFLRELTLGFFFPLCLTVAAIWWFYRMVYPHYDLTPMSL